MPVAHQMRKLALALPDVVEKSHFGTPDFRVRDKIFAGLSRDELIGYVKLTPELQAGLIGSRPETFFAASGAWGLKGWTHLRLQQVTNGELKELLAEAWHLIAPKRVGAPGSTPSSAAPSGRPRATKKKALRRS